PIRPSVLEALRLTGRDRLVRQVAQLAIRLRGRDPLPLAQLTLAFAELPLLLTEPGVASAQRARLGAQLAQLPLEVRDVGACVGIVRRLQPGEPPFEGSDPALQPADFALAPADLALLLPESPLFAAEIVHGLHDRMRPLDQVVIANGVALPV